MINEATANFITLHAQDDIHSLALKGNKYPDVDITIAINQISGKRKAIKKLPTWAATEGIIYPPLLSMEQCSSEITALYKTDIAKRLIKRREYFIDLTGGFGVDFSYISRSFTHAIYVEQQSNLCDIVQNNLEHLGINNAQIIHDNAVDFLKRTRHVDLIYIDPARRNMQGGRTFAISDCTPDVTLLADILLDKADYVIVKLSPMLDWKKAVTDLPNVTEVHIVSVGNECKELLLVMHKQVSHSLQIYCINNDQHISFSDTSYSQPLIATSQQLFKYLYEPNASIMKAGCFGVISKMYPIRQISDNSHLFVSEEWIEHFPGRKFTIDDTSTFNKKEIKTKLGKIKKANIAVRNFPLTVNELRKRLKISEGGSTYIFATTLADNSHILLITH